jgi:cell division protein FtsB
MIRSLKKNFSTIIYVVLILLAVWVSYIIVYGKGGIVKRRTLEAEIVTLKSEIRRLEVEREMIDLHIRNMKENVPSIEGYARELGYKKEGEVIYKFIEKEPSAPKP